ncbi:hypothetical protein SAMN05216326_12515 [Nitrosomonas marina]|uniref:Uncharacterized protein n=1 Tax=Nitrosomonas marina TaxID=917 RepID=A0A1I0E574_9PROT|nr:hypothetical protein [Nitrosomonas marina]SET40293.1 hypothetical protein SAMN05216326_12515 [Nitrosomonas marina]
MSRENIVHDVRFPCWGHDIGRWSDDDWTKVVGFLTPLPIPRDFFIAKGGGIFEFTEVKPAGRPRDLFYATIKSTDIVVNEDENPTYADIKGHIKSITQDQHPEENTEAAG